MRKWLLLFLFFLSFKLVKAQWFNDRQIDNSILSIPRSSTFSTTDIAAYIKRNYKSDYSKVSAAYVWVTNNLRYDTDSANIINLGTDPGAKVTAALRRRKGVCENYAAIFNDICLKSGLQSFVVDGYTKQGGTVDKTGHAWCAIFIDSTWKLCDPTWDVGGNTKYFLPEPSEMITSHIPYDPMWQLLAHPVSHQQFNSGNFYQTKEQPVFYYADTIAAFSKLDSLQKYKTSAFRIEHSGLYNNMVKNNLNYKKMQIEIIRQDKDVDLYNSSVSNLNDATNIYNNFVQFRNKQFTPLITDDALQALLSGIDAKLLSANKMLDVIDKTEATFTFSTEAVREKLNALASRVSAQKDFLKIYFNTAKASRQLLFYNKQTSAK